MPGDIRGTRHPPGAADASAARLADGDGGVRVDAARGEPGHSAVRGLCRAVRVLDRCPGVDLRGVRPGSDSLVDDLRADLRPTRAAPGDRGRPGPGDRGTRTVRRRTG